jgi:hypothetical protein
MGRARYVIIAAEDGYVVQIRVAGQQLVLSAVFGLDESLGKALATCQLAVEHFRGRAGLTLRAPTAPAGSRGRSCADTPRNCDGLS